MQRSRKAPTGVRFTVPAPLRSLSSFGRAPGWYLGEGGSKPSESTSRPLVQRQRQCAQTASSRSSNLRWPTSSRRLAQRKSVGPTNRRSRYRNSQRLPTHCPVAQWQSTRPITGGPRIVPVRDNHFGERRCELTNARSEMDRKHESNALAF